MTMASEASEARGEVEREAILLDVGSTNSRAWLVRDGAIVARETAPVGVRDSARDGSTRRVRETVRRLVSAVGGAAGRGAAGGAARGAATGRGAPPRLVIAAGMITSPLGLAEVPHIAAPASAGDLARGAVLYRPGAEDGDGERDGGEGRGEAMPPILLVPGVRTTGRADRDALTADVMRGEETLVFGLLAQGLLDPESALITASSHWKLIRVDAQGRVAGSRTSIGGEVVHAMQTATLLTASLPEGPLGAVDAEWLDAGAAAARRDGLLRALFGVRLLDQQGTATPAQRHSWLVGACVSEDVDALVAARAIGPGARVAVSGPAAVPAAWTRLLTAAGYRAATLSAADVEQAFVNGLLHIARLRAELDREAGIGPTSADPVSAASRRG